MVKCKPIDAVVRNYQKGVIRARREGKKSDKWLEGCLRASVL